jgi:hypothetical protein
MKLIKNWLGSVILLIIGVAACVRVFGQYNILREARITNAEIIGKIEKYREENEKWKMKIQYATSSAFLEQQVRNQFGMGNTTDVWVDEINEPDLDLYPKTEIKDSKNNWQKWIDLFTR